MLPAHSCTINSCEADEGQWQPLSVTAKQVACPSTDFPSEVFMNIHYNGFKDAPALSLGVLKLSYHLPTEPPPSLWAALCKMNAKQCFLK